VRCGGRSSGFGRTAMSKAANIRIAIIAAMEREVAPLIRDWKVRMIEHDGRRYRLFENGDAVVICGGIGAEAARRATEAVIQEVDPYRVLSVGFAGGVGSMPVGQVIEPRIVINAADGSRTDVGSGEGILVTFATVAGKEQKAQLGRSYGAIAVDMEAATVAQGAQARGVEFAALRAISDAADFSMPAMDRFVAHDGSFQSVRFACHVALRPWRWAATIALARNGSRASRSLSAGLQSYLSREKQSVSVKSAMSAQDDNCAPACASAHTGVVTGIDTRGERNSRI
jgi:adenosylhomocysteine nucleosidase